MRGCVASAWLRISRSLGLCLITLTACSEAPEERAAQLAAPTRAVTAAAAPAQYVGSSVCGDCHAKQYDQWRGSHHEQAMQPATAASVLGNFDAASLAHNGLVSHFMQRDGRYVVRTDGPDGHLQEYAVSHTFGREPLQQYLVDIGAGRLQALSLAWEGGAQRWFHLYPQDKPDATDVRHWTRASATWNHMCADCHSTAVTKGYDADARVYDTRWAEISVGCEACHGPGSQHLALAQNGADRDQLTTSLISLTPQASQVNVCAPCHSRRSQLAEGFHPQASLFDHYQPALLDSALYHADGQMLDEVYVYGSFLQSKMYARGVRCTDCHNAHSMQLKLPGNAVCVQCHNPAGRQEFQSLPRRAYDTREHHHHEPGSAGAQCQSCHMPSRTYMLVDPRADHSFRIPRPDLTQTLGVPNACNGCHEQATPQWADAAITAWFGPQRAPHFATAVHAGRRGEPDAEAALVAIADNAEQPAIVRATALSLLLDYDLRLSSASIERGLRDPHPLVRIGALRAALRWAPMERWRRVQSLLTDPRLAVRVAAVTTLLDVMPQLDARDQARLREHLQRYLEVLDGVADTAEGQTNRAGVYMALQNPRAAESALRESLRINPDWVPGMINLADVLRATGRDAEAGTWLEQALQRLPDDAQVLLANALWQVRNAGPNAMAMALPMLQKAHDREPRSAQVVYVYMVALNSSGAPQRALAVADAFLLRRYDVSILQLAASIARDAGLIEKFNDYRSGSAARD